MGSLRYSVCFEINVSVETNFNFYRYWLQPCEKAREGGMLCSLGSKTKAINKIKSEGKKGGKVKKKTKQVCVGGGQKIFHTKSICWSECTFAKKKMKK